MAKKSQTNSRRNNTQAGHRVVNFYNHGTVNVDARQNRSHTHKTENNGCTINYPCHPVRNRVGDYFDFENLDLVEIPTKIVEHTVPDEQRNVKTIKAIFKVAAGLAITVVAVGLIKACR